MWNGTFSPSLRKSIGTVRFVPLTQMTARDWRWLDFDNTRTVAQNRIAQMIMSGRLRGFFQVMIEEKAAKNEYFWPADEIMVGQFAADDHSFFTHQAETFTTNDALEGLNRLRNGMFAIPLWAVIRIIQVIHRIADAAVSEELDAIEQAALEEMEREDIEILLAAIMMWEMSLEEAEAILDDLPESDEADEARDWINDQVAALNEARNLSTQIAAGRGL